MKSIADAINKGKLLYFQLAFWSILYIFLKPVPPARLLSISLGMSMGCLAIAFVCFLIIRPQIKATVIRRVYGAFIEYIFDLAIIAQMFCIISFMLMHTVRWLPMIAALSTATVIAEILIVLICWYVYIKRRPERNVWIHRAGNQYYATQDIKTLDTDGTLGTSHNWCHTEAKQTSWLFAYARLCKFALLCGYNIYGDKSSS